ncbi:MAG: DMT family transporter [Oscillospiraceae bacterium]|nr:DMT family transporter [Oscillospiraceae bacterium]
MKFLQNRSFAAELGIVLVTMIWGSSFVVVKNATDTIPPEAIIVFRFGIASVFLCLFFFRRLKEIQISHIKWGLLIGLQNFIAYELQTVGVKYTTAGNNAFLTAVYCVIVPFLYWAVKKQKPRLFHLISACLCMIGVGLISIKSGLSINPGDLLSLACGLFFAIQIVTISILTEKNDPILLCITQSVATVIFALPFALHSRNFSALLPAQSIVSLLYLGLIGTMLTTVLQTICQKYTPPSKASLIMSLESVFGTICGIIFLHESLTLRSLGGFLLIFLAILLSERGDLLFAVKEKLKTHQSSKTRI